jgi:hypothetical protein
MNHPAPSRESNPQWGLKPHIEAFQGLFGESLYEIPSKNAYNYISADPHSSLKKNRSAGGI